MKKSQWIFGTVKRTLNIKQSLKQRLSKQIITAAEINFVGIIKGCRLTDRIRSGEMRRNAV